LLSALAGQDLGVDAVDYIILTHIHLDHAGGAGRLAAELPRARVLVHPRGVSHMIDPSILVAATKMVYGADRFSREYGEIMGIPADRVEPLDDGRRIQVGGRTLEVIHTPGHALHHLCLLDRDAGEVFTAAGEFIFPTTTPSQFDPIQLHASIDRVRRTEAKTAYLTHYGRVGHLDKLSLDLHSDIDAFVRIARSVAAEPDRVERMTPLLFDHLSARLDRHGFPGDSAQRHAVLDGDVALNAAGLHSWLARRIS
jgi:glyoxylase-like metal-dependent hydrolase (beta-lactamase superfamily II)